MNLRTNSCFAQPAISGAVTSFRAIDEVIDKWRPDRQLFIHGNIGVGDRQLQELAQWLATNGPHWTVVLMDSANGQVYQSIQGDRFKDLGAVESALGNGLSNLTDFGKLLHPETKESDGAIFILSLQERQFSYFASDAQDTRDLGEAHWVGELDQPARRAMRSGGRIVDAVKDTIKNIDGKLSRIIQAEKNAQVQKEQQRQRLLVQAKTELNELRLSIGEVEAAGLAFAKEFPQATGALAKPPTADWLTQVKALEQKLDIETVSVVEQEHAKLESEVSRYLSAYAARKGFKQEREAARIHLTSLSRSSSPRAVNIVTETQQILDKSQQQLENGELEFVNSLSTTESQLKRGDSVVAEEEQRRQLAEMQSRWVRATSIIILSIVALVVAMLMWLANRRRAATMHKAIDQVSSRIQSIAAETDRLDKLFQRNDDILGSRDNLQQRGYVGTTQQLATRALDYVDDLFIMSKEVKRVASEAEQLIHPSSPWNKLVNLFSAARYQDAIDHVTGAPLKFTRTTGIPLIVRDMGIGKVSATSESGIPDEVSLSFDEIFGVLQQRAVDAEHSLKTIEDCLANVMDQLAQTQKQFETATSQEKQLDTQAAQDRYFDAPSYFSTLLPAVQANIKSADDLSAFDAVQAVQGPLTIAQRQLNESMQVGRCLLSAREELFPKLQADAETLKKRGYISPWIGDQLITLTRTADDLFKKAATTSIASDATELSKEISNLGVRSSRIVELATQIDDTFSPALQSLQAAIADTRSDVAAKLKLKPDQILQELDRNPDDELARARASIETAKAMLLQGRVSAIEEALATYQTAKKIAENLLDATKGAVKAYGERRQTLLQALATGQARAPQLKRGIEEARSLYAASALIVNPNAQQPTVVTATVVDNSANKNSRTTNVPSGRPMDWYLSEVEQGNKDVQRKLTTAEQHHSGGEVLTAAEELAQAASTVQVINNQLQQIDDHLHLLENQSRENVAHQQRNEALLETLQRAERNPRVTAATLSLIARSETTVRGNQRLVQAQEVTPNPFETSQVLLQTQRQLEQLQAQIVGDEQAFAEARRAAAGARQQLEQANQLVRQSQSDGIPDSQQIVQTNSRITDLSRQLRDIENDLEVAHGDWQSIDSRAARVQAELSSSTKTLGSELSSASQALAAFQQASQLVLQAGQWSGPWGVRVPGSPGVTELERARSSLQNGNYNVVLQVSQIALLAAQAAIQSAEREVARRRMEEEREREAARRAREEATRRSTSNSFGNNSFGGGSFGGSFGGGSSSSSSSSSSGSAASGSGFSRSGW